MRRRRHPEDASEQELYWLAGLLEGEGSFLRGSPSAPHQPAITIVMRDRDVMTRLADLLDVKAQVVRPRREHWHVAYSARVRGARAVAWMRALRPLMGARRQMQIDRAIQCYEERPRRGLEEEDAHQALRLLAAGFSVRQVAAVFGTTVWCIYDLRLGRTYRHLDRSALSPGPSPPSAPARPRRPAPMTG